MCRLNAYFFFLELKISSQVDEMPWLAVPIVTATIMYSIPKKQRPEQWDLGLNMK
jgi:uncharacterized protein with ParB-like and HNH nuclease domain